MSAAKFYLYHYHVYEANTTGFTDHVACHEQNTPIYESPGEAQAAAEAANAGARLYNQQPWYYANECRSHRLICGLKINGFSNLDQVPAAPNYNKVSVPREKPDLRFYWVANATNPYALPAAFCQHQHKSPETAKACRDKTLKRKDYGLGQVQQSRMVVKFPDQYLAFFPIPEPPPERRYQVPPDWQ